MFFAEHGEQAIGSRPSSGPHAFITDDVTGPAPTTCRRGAAPGDVVRFRRTAEGGWRLAQIPEAQGAFVSIDPSRRRHRRAERRLRLLPQQLQSGDASRAPTGLVVQAIRVLGGLRERLHACDRRARCASRTSAISSRSSASGGPRISAASIRLTRLREALFESMNSVSIKMLQSIGMPVAISHVKRFGFDGVGGAERLVARARRGRRLACESRGGLRRVRERRLQGHAVLHRSHRDGRRRVALREQAADLPRLQHAARNPGAARAREAGARLRHHGAISEAAGGAARRSRHRTPI